MRDMAAFEIREGLAEPGCAVCRLAMRSVSRFMQSVAYEQVNDIDLRNQLRQARGFCNSHAHRWLHEVQSVLGTAIIYRDILNAALRGDKRKGTCVACEAQLEAEDRYVNAMVALLGVDDEARRMLEASDGPCYRHVRMAQRRRGPGADYVAQHSRRSVEALLTHLDEVIRKEDYRFRHEERTDAERAAPPRAVRWIAGIEGLTDAGARG